MFGIARWVAALLRYRKTIDIHVAIEGLREDPREKRGTPAKISSKGTKTRVWPIAEPYVVVLTSNH